MKPHLLSLIVLLLPVLRVGAARPLTLVQDGQPAATIVLATNATRAAQLGAFELQAHIKEITGATLPITNDTAQLTGPLILVGDSAKTRALGLRADNFKSQEYLVRCFRNAIVLLGCDKADTGKVIYNPSDPDGSFYSWPGLWDERGTLNACYDFLETFCGVRWFNPTEFGLVCPKTSTLAVSGPTIRRVPSFRYRDVAIAFGPPEHYDAHVGLWPADSAELKAYEVAAYPTLHAKFPGAAFPFGKRWPVRLFELRMREGGEIVECNHSFYGYYYRFWEKEPTRPELFVAKRPEYFAQGYPGKPPQLCYTSPELLQQVAQDARDYFDGKKNGNDLGIFWQPRLPNPFPLEPMDNASYCKCDRCQALLKNAPSDQGYFSSATYSEYFFHLVNQVAQQTRPTHPHGRFVTLAYAGHAAPPSFPVDPRVAVEFCFAANRLPYLRDYAHEMTLLRQWAKRKNPLYLWLYDTFPAEAANGGGFHCFPGFFAHKIGEQMKQFHKLGVRGFAHCGYGQDVEAYVTYRLMDDVTLNVDALLTEYFTRLYGPAGQPLHEFYDLVEQTYGNPANYPKGAGHQTMQIAWSNLGTPERMARLGQLVNDAKALAATDLQRQRVALWERSVWSYMVAGRNQYLERTGAPLPSAAIPATAAGHPDWSKAVTLGPWHAQSSNQPAARPITARALHDDKFLYLELTDPCDPAKLQDSGMVFPCDDWEIFVAAQRALPYRQFAVSPKGQLAALSNGEVNWRLNVPIADDGLRVESDRSANDKWVTRLTIPLASLTAQGVPATGKFYLNLTRVSSSPVTGAGIGIDAWVAFSKVHDVDRLAEITLAP